MKHIKVTQIEVTPGAEYNFGSYPADGMYLIQKGATLVARANSLVFLISGGAFLVSEMAEPQVPLQVQSTITESTFLKALAMMQDANLVNKFDL